MKPITLKIRQWVEILKQIKETYPPSVHLSREKMRRVLGFTPRVHRERVDIDSTEDTSYGYKKTVYLDFFDEQQRTMFLLKYGDYLRD